jgi:putative ABC transport system permease protein
MIGHMQNVLGDVAVYQVSGPNVYRTPKVPPAETGGIGVDAAGGKLPELMGARMLSGHFLDAVSDRFPEVVLGTQAATVLQISHAGGGVLVNIGNTWFTVIGIMGSATLDTSLDSQVFISLPVAQRMFQTQPNPSEIYVRANQDEVTWGPSLCSSARSGSRTSWSYPSWNGAERLACAAPSAPPDATSRANSSPNRRSSPCSVESPD